MTDRERFEAWLTDWQRGTGPLSTPGKVMARACWQAAQAAPSNLIPSNSTELKQAAPGEAVAIEQLRGLLEAVRVFRNEPMLGALTKLRGTQSYHDMTVAWKDADDFIRDLAAPAQTEPDGWNAAIEAAKKVCEAYAQERWALYKGHKPYVGNEQGRADPAVQGEADGATACVELIRALAKEQS